jgi:phosphoglycolate phosphatase-like HAD superfamily hydrolase
MTIVSAPRLPFSTVIWDVGGTLVDRVMGPMELLARALKTVGLTPEAIAPATIEAAHQHYFRSECEWSTEEEERLGCEEIAAILLDGLEASDAARIERLAQALGESDQGYRPVPGIPELLDELGRRGIRQAVGSNWPPSLPRFLRFR